MGTQRDTGCGDTGTQGMGTLGVGTERDTGVETEGHRGEDTGCGDTETQEWRHGF